MATRFDSFPLSNEGFEEPLHDPAAAHLRRGVPERSFTALQTGETHHFTREQFERAALQRAACA